LYTLTELPSFIENVDPSDWKLSFYLRTACRYFVPGFRIDLVPARTWGIHKHAPESEGGCRPRRHRPNRRCDSWRRSASCAIVADPYPGCANFIWIL